jgi:plasmid stabilization system protein ParE
VVEDEPSQAPGALSEELKASIALIRSFPQAGQLVEGQRGPVHRVLLRRVRYMLYYRSEGDRVTVLALWHANRGRAPDL